MGAASDLIGLPPTPEEIHAFLAEPHLSRKLHLLLDQCTDPDEGSQAVAQLIAERVANSLPGRGLTKLDVTLREHPDAWAGYTMTLD